MKLIKKSDLLNKNFWEVEDEELLNLKGIEFDGDVSVFDAFEIDDKIYICSVTFGDVPCAIINEVHSDNFYNPEDKDYEDELTCPYCDYKQESFELNNDEDEYFCGNCGSTYSFQRIVNITYCSQPLKINSNIRKVI